MNTTVGIAVCILFSQLSGELLGQDGTGADGPVVAVDALREATPRDIAPDEAAVTIDELPREPDKLPTTPGQPEFRAPFADANGPMDADSPVDATSDQLVPVRSRGQHALPAVLLLQALSPPADDPSDTKPVSLVEALSSRRPGVAMFDVVSAYWALSTRLAAHRLAKSESKRLGTLQARDVKDEASLAAARAMAAVDEAEARLPLIDARHDLQATQMPRANMASASPSIATQDYPHTTGYRTEYERLFPSGAAVNHEAKRIHEWLPAQRNGIVAGARAIIALETLLDQKVAEYERGQTDIDSLLACHDKLHQRRQAFLAAVKDYNVKIGRYVAIVAPHATAESQIVRMLIKTPMIRNATNDSAEQPRRVSSVPTGRDELPSVLKRRGVVRAVPRANDPSKVVPAGAEDPIETSEPSRPDETSRDGFRPRRDP